MVRFIHTADCHIDSPLKGLEKYEGCPADRIQSATREAFRNLVDLALEESVDFILIAGDLFDGRWPDMETGLWTARQFDRLREASIPVYLIRGNHDAASQVRSAITWPGNVYEFSTDQPETKVLEDLGVILHGQGFAHRVCDVDLTAAYPQPLVDGFNIGLLHTSLTGDANHDPYAPTTCDRLVACGYDYWALGHIHTRSQPPLCQRPYIAFSGNTQGRHVRETGAKGCLLVSLDGQEVAETEFRATDTLRWHVVPVPLDAGDDVVDLLAKVGESLVRSQEASEGRFSACRLIVRGACLAHRQLSDEGRRQELEAEIRNRARQLDADIWVEKIRFQTRPPIDRRQLRESHDLIGDLLRAVEPLRERDEELLQAAHCLAPLWDRAAGELQAADIEWESPEALRRWLDQAEALLLAGLWESDESCPGESDA